VICKDDEDGGTLDDNFIAQIEDKRFGSIKIVESGKEGVVLKRDLLIFHSLFISNLSLQSDHLYHPFEQFSENSLLNLAFWHWKSMQDKLGYLHHKMFLENDIA
jgi:hypothetical protein